LTNTIDTMLLEERRYAPEAEFARQANAQPEIYERDWEELWETEGRERVTWFEPFTKLSNGKIMRRLLRDVAEQRELGDTTTLADPTVRREDQGLRDGRDA
jgi:flavin-dependent dehydrogenase